MICYNIKRFFEKGTERSEKMKPSGLLRSMMAILLTLGISSYIYYYHSVKSEEERIVLNEKLYVPALFEEEEKNIEVEESTIDVVIEEAIVYDNLTLSELAAKLDRVLSSDLTGKGYTFASYSIELGVDPYLAVAIAMHETGCTWNCSYLAKTCNNVGGQKGTGCGEYQAYDSLDEGIYGFIANIKNKYVDYGLYTAEEMNPKYAEDPQWSAKVNKYIEKIKNS